MPSFDVVSEIDMQEIRNAVDQASREIGNRYDFKNTGSSLHLNEMSITLSTSTEDRLVALRQVLEEKLVRRQISLKSISYEEIQEASQATVRQIVTLHAGISSEKAKELINDGYLKNYNIEALAKACGFKATNSFYRIFKNETGLTPKMFSDTTKN